jgi:hypothetical protein
MPKARPLIAIVGSVDPTRDYNPPLRDAAKADDACREIGAALAEARCDLLLFSSKPRYVEADVFLGYASAGQGGTVVVKPPQHAVVEFKMPGGSSTEVRVEHDPSGEWELPYYRSMMDCDGVVIVGGGQSSRIAGVFALLHGVPVLPVAAFGGGAVQVRTNLGTVRNDALDTDIALLGRPWTSGLATELVAALLGQVQRRQERLAAEARGQVRARWANWVALTVSMIALIACWLAFPFAGTGAGVRGLTFVMVVPMLAAVAGALLRNSRRGEGWGWSAVSGLAAGLVSVLLYLTGELAAQPDLLSRLDPQRMLLFLVPLGFIAGFTFDRILEKVLKGQTRVPPGAAAPPV